MNILVFGDSIAYGLKDKKGGWVSRLRSWIDKKYREEDDFEGQIYNLGISGDTTAGVLSRFKTEAKARLCSEGKTIIIFAIGVNDSEYFNSEDRMLCKPNEFEENIKKLIKRATGLADRVLFLGLLPVDESRVDPIPWAPERSYKDSNIKRFNGIIAEVCAEQNIDFVGIYDRFKRMEYKKLLEDGVHPTSKAHKRIYRIVREELGF